MIRLTPVVKNLIIINVLVFALVLVNMLPAFIINDYLVLHKSNLLGFRPPTRPFLPTQLIGHLFMHSSSSIMHILFNMLALASLGPIIEMVMGPKNFLKFYLFCGIFGGLLVALFDPSHTPVVGASGAIFGVFVAFAMKFPDQKLMFFFLPPVKARILVPVLGGISLVLVVLEAMGSNVGGGISHFGHLAGMVSALIFFYGERFLPLNDGNQR